MVAGIRRIHRVEGLGCRGRDDNHQPSGVHTWALRVGTISLRVHTLGYCSCTRLGTAFGGLRLGTAFGCPPLGTAGAHTWALRVGTAFGCPRLGTAETHTWALRACTPGH